MFSRYIVLYIVLKNVLFFILFIGVKEIEKKGNMIIIIIILIYICDDNNVI